MKNKLYLVLVLFFVSFNIFALVKNSEYKLSSKGNVDGVSYYIAGSTKDVETSTSNAYILMGGGKICYDATDWMLDRAGGKGKAGDIVELNASSISSGWNNLYNNGDCNSVISLVVDSKTKADSQFVYDILLRAEGVFLAGGDQTKYFNYWKGTKVEKALKYLILEKKIPIAGTSAGMATISGFSYLPEVGDESATTANVLSNIYHSSIQKSEIKEGLLKTYLPEFLQNIITDTHFSPRDRMGRFIVLVARLVEQFDIDFTKAGGIACDEETAVCIDEKGFAQIFARSGSNGAAYFIKGSSDKKNIILSPFSWNGSGISVYKITGTTKGENAFNIVDWSGTGGIKYIINAENGKLKSSIDSVY